MNDINQTVVSGRLTRDGETKFTSGGTAVGSFSLAVNRSYKKGDEWVEEEPTYVDCTAWGKLAEACGKLTKSAAVVVIGRIKQDRWQDKDGGPRSKLYVVAERVERVARGEE